MAREIFQLKTTRLIEAIAPTNVITCDPLDFTGDGATCVFKVYDPAKDEAISAVEAIGQTILSVTNAGVFVDGDTIEVLQDDGTLHFSPIIVGGVDTTANTITITSGITVAAAIGNAVRKLFGPVISMTEFGTPDINTRDWGFRGAIPSNHASQIDGQDVDIEITFLGTGSPAGGLDVFEVICATFSKACTNGD